MVLKSEASSINIEFMIFCLLSPAHARSCYEVSIMLLLSENLVALEYLIVCTKFLMWLKLKVLFLIINEIYTIIIIVIISIIVLVILRKSWISCKAKRGKEFLNGISFFDYLQQRNLSFILNRVHHQWIFKKTFVLKLRRSAFLTGKIIENHLRGSVILL